MISGLADAVLGEIAEPVVVVENGRLAFVNEAAARLVGQERALLAGARVENFFVAPDAAGVVDGSTTVELRHADGSTLRVRARLLAHDGARALLLEGPEKVTLAARRREELESLLLLAGAAGGLEQPKLRAQALEVVRRATASDAVVLFERHGDALTPALVAGATPAELKTLQELAKEGIAHAERVLAGSPLSRAAAVPVQGAGESLGLLVAGRRGGPAFTDDDRAVLGAFGSSLGGAVSNARLFRESSRQVHDLQSLFELGRAVAGERDLPRVFRLAARTAAGLVNAQEVFLFSVGDALGEGHLPLRACLHDGVGPVHPGAATEAEAHALLARARELSLSSLRQRAAVAEACVLPPELGHLAAAPLVAGERPLGCLVAARLAIPGATHDLATFEASDVQRLRAVADYAAVAMQSGELFAEQQRRVRELSLLNEVAADCAELGLDRLLPAVTQRICRAIGAELAALLFFDAEREELITGAVSSPRGPVAGARRRAQVGRGLGVKALVSRQPRRGLLDELGIPEIEALARDRGLSHATAVPLLVKDRAIGIVCAARAGRSLTDDELRLLVAICSEIAVAVENARLFAEAQRRAADLELVRNVGDVIVRSLEPREILRETSLKLCEALEADAVRIYLREGRTYRAAIDHGIPREAAQRAERVTQQDPVVALALSAQQPIALVPAEMPEPTRSYCAAIDISRLAAAPLSVAGPAGLDEAADRGVLVIGRKAQRSFAPTELRVIGAVASQLAVALQNAQLYSQTRQAVEDLSIVAEAGRALVGGAPVETALDGVATRLARLVGTRACVIFLMDDSGGQLRVGGISAGLPETARELIVAMDHPNALSARAVRERKPLADLDYARYAEPMRTEYYFGLPPPWAYALPLLAGDRPVGAVLLIDDLRRDKLSEPELDRTAAIANQVANAVERARLNEALERSLVELAQAQAQLVRRERLAALGELAALVAHEVRNPLGVIFNSLGSLAKMVELHGDARRVYDIIREEADRLNRIVGDMLDYTRPTEPRLRPGALDRVLSDALQSAVTSERNRGTHVEQLETELRIEPDLPPVPMDERLIHQALVNLLSNALQSTPKGGHVTLSAHLIVIGERRYARIEVSDDGPGIPRELTTRLFEPFFTTKATGSGLGLAVVKRIVDGHRGEVAVRTAPGKGTTFAVDLPIDPPEDAAFP